MCSKTGCSNFHTCTVSWLPKAELSILYFKATTHTLCAAPPLVSPSYIQSAFVLLICWHYAHCFLHPLMLKIMLAESVQDYVKGKWTKVTAESTESTSYSLAPPAKLSELSPQISAHHSLGLYKGHCIHLSSSLHNSC